MASSGYFCRVMHQRLRPFQYKFEYGVFSLKIDIDTIESEAAKLRWFSFNRFNLIHIRQSDFGDRSEQNWRQWIDKLLLQYGLSQPASRVELVCMPRILGFNFNPLAMWYAYNPQDELIAIIGEVSNTFGQWHHYVLCEDGKPLNNTTDTTNKIQTETDKVFHVSPFIGMESHYRFRLNVPDKHYHLIIEQSENQQPTLLATQNGKETPLTDLTLLKVCWRFPFQTTKVLGMIHWWALKIWLKGGKFHKTPNHLANLKHTHSEMTLC